MVEVKVESHKVGVTSYRLTSLSFMSIDHPIPEIRLFQNLTLEIHKVGVTSYRLTSLSFMSIDHPIPEIQLFQNLTLEIQGQSHG